MGLRRWLLHGDKTNEGETVDEGRTNDKTSKQLRAQQEQQNKTGKEIATEPDDFGKTNQREQSWGYFLLPSMALDPAPSIQAGMRSANGLSTQ